MRLFLDDYSNTLVYGTQLASAVSDTYKAYKAYAPILAWIFQITALYILYSVSKVIVSGFFARTPWAYPLISAAKGDDSGSANPSS